MAVLVPIPAVPFSESVQDALARRAAGLSARRVGAAAPQRLCALAAGGLPTRGRVGGRELRWNVGTALEGKFRALKVLGRPRDLGLRVREQEARDGGWRFGRSDELPHQPDA